MLIGQGTASEMKASLCKDTNIQSSNIMKKNPKEYVL